MRGSSGLCFCIVAFLAIACLNEAKTPSGLPDPPNISYQIHSMNDLREWPALLAKGTHVTKIDMWWVPSETCALQDSVTSSHENGCFLLTHDKPDVDNVQYPSYDDVLRLLETSSLSHHFTHSSPFYIALCFKSPPKSPCSSDPLATTWKDAITQIFNASNDIVSSSSLNVEFILDGAATPTDSRSCLNDMWRPWGATWIRFSSASGAFDDDNPPQHDRFTFMNIPQNKIVPKKPQYNLEKVQKKKYGKFASRKEPFLFWEPANQSTIMTVSKTYQKLIHDPGFHFAINIDPVMFSLYASRAAGGAWNVETHGPGTSPQDSPPLTGRPNGQRSIMGWSSGGVSYVAWVLADSSSDPTYELYTTDGLPEPLELQSHGSISTSSSCSPTKFASAGSTHAVGLASNCWMQLTASASDGTLTSGSSFSVSSSNPMDIAVFHFNGESDPTVAVLVPGSSDCSVGLELFHWGSGKKINDNVICLIKDTPVTTARFGADFGASGVAYLIQFQSSDSDVIWYSSGVFDMVSNQITVESTGASSLDVGVIGAVEVRTRADNTPMALAVNGHSYCWHSEDLNKRREVIMCDSSPRPSSGRQATVNYAFAPLDAWSDAIESNSPLTPCSTTILYGSYDQGAEPEVALWNGPGVDGDTTLSMAELHIGKGWSPDQSGPNDSGSQPMSIPLLPLMALPLLTLLLGQVMPYMYAAPLSIIPVMILILPQAALLSSSPNHNDCGCGCAYGIEAFVIDGWPLPSSW